VGREARWENNDSRTLNVGGSSTTNDYRLGQVWAGKMSRVEKKRWH